MEKKQIRREAITKRKQQGYKKELLDIKIYDSIINLEEYKESTDLFIYIDFNYEVDTKKIIRHALSNGKKVYLPRVEGNVMVTVPIKDLNELQVGSFNILEPLGEECDLPDMALVIVPGVAFSEKGERIGYGGGFYDRFLEHRDNKLIAIAYECQIYKELTVESYDIKIPIIVTENRIISNNKN